jgi:chromosomal replication initiation ATPase DnaA
MTSAEQWLLKPSENAPRYLEAICKVSGLNKEDILSDSRERHLVRARQLFYACLRSEGTSWTRIARLVGRDHTTVMRGVDNVPSEAIKEILVLAKEY